MSSKLIAGNATNGSSLSADTTGILEIQTGSTPTTAITVDASQNVGIGTTPSAWGASYKAVQTSAGSMAGYSTTSFDLYGNAYDSSAGTWKYQNSGSGATRYAQYNGQHQWYNAPSGTAGNAVTFTQAMTLDSSGSLLINRTSNIRGAMLEITAKGSGYTSGISTDVSVAGNVNYEARYTGTSGTSYFGYFIYNGSVVGSITSTGSVTLYNTTSDQRLKENIVDAGSGLDKLANVKVRSFDWKTNQEKTDFGVVAQELFEVAPECVTVGTDKEDGSIDKPWSVDTSALVPAMIKAIQELNAKVDAQAAEIQALKGVA